MENSINKKESLLISLIFILISLHSYYSYTLSVAIFPYIGLMTFYLYNRKFIIDKFLFTLLIFISYVFLITLFNLNKYNIQIASLFALCFSAFFVINKFDKKIDLNYIIKFYLLFHAFFFWMQLVGLLLNFHIDYIEWYTGVSQRTGTGTFEVFGGQLFRPTGLFTEPSTFFIHFAPIVAIKWLLIDKKLTISTVFFLITSLLTFSSFGFIYWILIFIIVFFETAFIKKNIEFSFKNIFFMIVLLIPLVFIYDYFMFFLDTKLGLVNEANSNADRVGFLLYVVNQEVFRLLFGIGFNEESIDYIVNDSGTIIYFIYKFGLISVIFLLSMMLFLNRFINKILFILLLLTKLPVTYPFFWLVYWILLRYK